MYSEPMFREYIKILLLTSTRIKLASKQATAMLLTSKYSDFLILTIYIIHIVLKYTHLNKFTYILSKTHRIEF